MSLDNLKTAILKSLKLDTETQDVPGWHFRSVTASGEGIGRYWTQTVLEAAPSKPVLFYKPRADDAWLALMRLEDINPAYCLYDEAAIVNFETAIMIIREDIYRCTPNQRGH